MKPIHALFLTTAFLTMAQSGIAFGAPITPNYANSISVHNIKAIQHSIITNALETYEGTMASALGTRAKLSIPKIASNNDKDPTKYGTMRLYGEFNDDGTAITTGHNGGDDFTDAFHNVWANWQHFNDKEHFNNFGQTKANYDIVTLGTSSAHTQIGQGVSQWGVYGGFINSNQENKTLKITENGGYIGVYSGYSISNFNISATMDAGLLYNDTKNDYSDAPDYTNAWLGAGAHIAYNIELDASLTLQPMAFVEYTWVKSGNYKIGDDKISNTNLKNLAFTPGLRAIKHITNGWFGTAGGRYVFNNTKGAITSVNGTDLAKLKSDNYVEYGIGIEKSIDRFNISLHINRHDGGRTGWNGGTSFKYLF